MTRLTRDDVLKELICFFEDAFKIDPLGTSDFIVQGDHDADEFFAAVQRVKKELTLRDGPQ
ncbi:hypothetical protein [Bradyrhizobium sp. Tv2a-2]|uniref:hypothetical protein n=1 Tax=Bradyrhizobium sp. Tv2a-2 TaxID=113395 RepID=UPI0004129E5E|nr:hypothetical protein [Bradyrhizobium sp. Tv2a-2]